MAALDIGIHSRVEWIKKCPLRSARSVGYRLSAMRLRDIQGTLDQSLPYLRPTVETANSAAGKFVLVHGRAALLHAVSQLQEISGFRASAVALLSLPFIKQPGDELALTPEQSTQLTTYLNDLLSRGELLREVLKAVVPPAKPFSVAIRLPHAEDLATLRVQIERVERVIQEPVKRILNESFALNGFDVGSEWLELVAASNGVLVFVGLLLSMSHQYIARQHRLRMEEEDARRLEIANNHLAALQEANAKILESFARKMAEEANAKHGPQPAPNENVNHTLHAIKELSKLLREGLKIKAALNAPPEVRREFDQPKELLAAIEPLLLGDGKQSDISK